MSFADALVGSEFQIAGVAELADALDSKSSDRKIVWVRAPPPAISSAQQSAGKDCAFIHGEVTYPMFCRAGSIALFLTGTFVLAPSALAQVASLQGNVLGTDGRPLQGAEVRIEATGKPSVRIITVTDSNGRYLFRELPAGLYKLSIIAGGAVKFSVNVKMRGEKARIDFDLSPTAEKKIRNYVWVVGRTGSNLPGRWAERERR